jgi:ferrous iron transport protein B
MPAVASNTLTVALIGNPNTGKSTLFTALAGVRQRVGNYPGVTVEKKSGHAEIDGRQFELIDLPGTYSLAPRSPDEMVAVDVLLGRQEGSATPHAVLCIVDASNLERNLYLVSQVLELGLPTVLALNMVDLAESRGLTLDVARLSNQLGVPVVPIQAHRRRGLDALRSALLAASDRPGNAPASPLPEPVQQEVARLREAFPSGNAPPRYLAERLLLETTGYLESTLLAGDGEAVRSELSAARSRLAEAGCPVPAVEAMARYGWVSKVLEGVVRRPGERRVTATDRIDRVLTHRLWGTLVLAAVMLLLFSSIYWAAAPFMDAIDGGVAWLGERLAAALPDGALESLLVDGIVAGVGGVVVFLPQIVLLFFFIGILEDCGYMARAAYLMDKLMVRVGLSGKSFIPMLSSFACAIPGVMAARVIENRRDRLTTILVAPLMSCSARVPVYVLMTSAFVPATAWLGGWLTLQGLVTFAMYVLGIVAAAGVALVLKRTLLRGPTPPFVMELPTYKWPSLRLVLWRMADRGWAFIRRAGTLILAVSIVIWALLYYPRDPAAEARFETQRAGLEATLADLPDQSPGRRDVEKKLTKLERKAIGEHQRQSLLGRAGHFIEPVVRPLGWDWRIGCAVIASFPAREVVVGTLGVIYNLGPDVDVTQKEGRTALGAALKSARWDGTGERVFNLPVALSLMVFFSLCAQCAATLAVIKRETNSWRWPAFTFVYMTGLAYLAALVTYRVGMWLS